MDVAAPATRRSEARTRFSSGDPGQQRRPGVSPIVGKRLSYVKVCLTAKAPTFGAMSDFPPALVQDGLRDLADSGVRQHRTAPLPCSWQSLGSRRLLCLLLMRTLHTACAAGGRPLRTNSHRPTGCDSTTISFCVIFRQCRLVSHDDVLGLGNAWRVWRN